MHPGTGTGWAAGRSNLVRGVINLSGVCLADGTNVFRVEVLAEGADVINVKVYARAVKEVCAEGAEVSRAEAEVC